MKEINNSLTNSLCLVPWRLASAMLWISRMKESQECASSEDVKK